MPQGVAAAVNRLTPEDTAIHNVHRDKIGPWSSVARGKPIFAICNLQSRIWPVRLGLQRGHSSVGRAPALQAGSQGFESLASKASEKRCCSGARSGAKFFGSAAAEIAASTTLNQSAARRVLSTISSSRGPSSCLASPRG